MPRSIFFYQRVSGGCSQAFWTCVCKKRVLVYLHTRRAGQSGDAAITSQKKAFSAASQGPALWRNWGLHEENE